MRRIILKPGETFSEDRLQRVGAFDARALTAATEIIETVRTQGDAALRAYTKQFDGVEIENFRVSDTAIDEAITRVDPEVSQALRQAAKQIRDFHERQKQQSWFTIREDGALVGAKVEPLDSVGIYVPGGRALYPSSVLMNAIPAAVAGVKRIVCVTPPTKDGSLDPASWKPAASPALPRFIPLAARKLSVHWLTEPKASRRSRRSPVPAMRS